MTKPNNDLVVLGTIVGVHGVGGMVKLKSFTQEPYAIGDYGPLLLGDTGRRLEIIELLPHKELFRARIKGIDDRSAAEALKGFELKTERSVLPPVEEDEFYFADLIGLAVKLNDDRVVGKIVDVVNFGAGDLLEIEFDGHNKTELLAFDEATVPVVDMSAGFVVVIPPDWMFEGINLGE